MNPQKPPNEVYRRLFSGKATPADKAQINAYNAGRRSRRGGRLPSEREQSITMSAPHSRAPYLHRTVRIIVPGAVYEMWFKVLDEPVLASWLIIRVARKEWLATEDGDSIVLSAAGYRQHRHIPLRKRDFFKSPQAAAEAVANYTNALRR